MTKHIFPLAAIGLIVSAVVSVHMLSGHDEAHDHGPAHLRQTGDFIFETSDLAELAAHADIIVMARHLIALPGRTAYSSNRESGIRFELAEFRVEQLIKGPRGMRSLTVERAQSDIDYPDAVMDLDGGPYETNQLYVLFLAKQPESSFFYLINTDARYAVDLDQRLSGIGQGEIARALHGKPLSELTGFLRSLFPAG